MTVEGVGTSHVYVIIPSVTGSEINQTIAIIQSQGNFEGVVNGKEAVNGSGIIPGSIGAVPPQIYNNTVSWAVTFYLTQSAAARFAEHSAGAGQPAAVHVPGQAQLDSMMINTSLLAANASSGISKGAGALCHAEGA